MSSRVFDGIQFRVTNWQMTDKIQYRTITLDTRKADSDKRTVPATLSSEQPVERGFGMEVLSHTKSAVNLEPGSDHGTAICKIPCLSHWTRGISATRTVRYCMVSR